MKKIALVVILMLTLLLTGCMHEYQLSAEETDVVAEFMAGTLLEDDENYHKNLLDQEELEVPDKEVTAEEKASSEEEDNNDKPAQNPEQKEETREEEGSGSAAEPMENFTISEVVGTEDFNITFNSYKLCDVYPEDETNTYYSLTPLEGNQLLVASFMVENITGTEKRLDLRKSKVEYQLDINVGTIYKPLMTILVNNLKYIDISIGAGKKEEVLLVFEVKKDIEMKDINLIVSNGDKTEIIDIK